MTKNKLLAALDAALLAGTINREELLERAKRKRGRQPVERLCAKCGRRWPSAVQARRCTC